MEPETRPPILRNVWIGIAVMVVVAGLVARHEVLTWPAAIAIVAGLTVWHGWIPWDDCPMCGRCAILAGLLVAVGVAGLGFGPRVMVEVWLGVYALALTMMYFTVEGLGFILAVACALAFDLLVVNWRLWQLR